MSCRSFALTNRKQNATAQVGVVPCAALGRSACRSEDRRSQPAAQLALVAVSPKPHLHGKPALMAFVPVHVER